MEPSQNENKDSLIAEKKENKCMDAVKKEM